MRALHRTTVALVVVLAAGGMAACGDDDDKASNAFCDAVVEFNSAVFNVEINEDTPKDEVSKAGAELGETFQPVVDNAPDEVEASAKEIDSVLDELAEGDAAVFNEDSTFEKYTTYIDGAVEACAFPEVAVNAEDYAFDAPDSIKGGTVAFAFENTSEKEQHEMILLAKADGVDLSWEELLDLPEEEAQSKTQFAGAAFAGPGDSGSTMAKLEPGEYVMVCFIPVGGEEDGPPHFTQGMLHEFTVE